MTDYLLTFTILTPLVAAVILLLLPAAQGLLIRLVALAGAALTLPPAVWLCLNYDRARGGFQFGQDLVWVPTLGIRYHVAVDGISVVLILLTALIITGGIFASWTRTDRTKEFFALLLLLVSGVLGVFAARDLFFLFLFYEIAVLPMYLLIGVWGTSTKERTKEYSAMKLTLMLLGGSAFILVAILALYFQCAPHSFDMDTLAKGTYGVEFQRWVFLALYVGFGVLAGIWPLHTWSPDGHASAPTAVSMLHAGVLMKLGAYGILRLGIGLLPQGAAQWSFLMAAIATINILYGAFSAMGQTDLKYIIAYSSVSHMGVVMLGLASLNTIGIDGAVLQMFSHGIMTGLFFAVVGLVYEKAHTRTVTAMGGFAKRMPAVSVCMTIGGLASFGLPATSGFIAEFLCFYGMWLKYPALALLSVVGIVLTAIYVLRMLQKIFLGPFREESYHELSDARTTEWVAISALAAALILVGIYPRPLVNLIHTGGKTLPGVEQARRRGPAPFLAASPALAKAGAPPGAVAPTGEVTRTASGRWTSPVSGAKP
ncbi:MAG TPA: NADH-quinone oxidoreductase subunit M [Chthonomonadaceae bacterium]|nr:NADH-quinone oxidoreductase subunit M [Chthonomonadaceae bacterium]